MKTLLTKITTLSLLLVPVIAFAQTQTGLATSPSGGGFGILLRDLLELTNQVLIPFILGIGFLVFVWGMFKFFILGGANDEEKEKGKSLMVWATLGFVLVIIFWGVVNLVAQSTGLDQDSNGINFNDNALNNIDLEGRGNTP